MKKYPSVMNLLSEVLVIIRFLITAGISGAAHDDLKGIKEHIRILLPNLPDERHTGKQGFLRLMMETGRNQSPIKKAVYRKDQPVRVLTFFS